MRRLFAGTPGALVAAALVALAAAPALAQDATVIYVEGEPEHRRANGSTDWVDFGSLIHAGDSVVTGSNDFVELEQATGAEIRVQPGTVFTVREVETGEERDTVLSTAVGSVRFRFDRIAGREPRIGTAAVVAGVRGTEVTVYAAPDGSSLFVVDSGEVEVSNAGESVTLTENQGVEVAAGAPPGEVFEVIGREVDYSDWIVEQVDALIADPERAIETLDGIEDTLTEYILRMEEWVRRYEEARIESDEARTEMNAIDDDAQRQTYRNETWLPLANQTATAVLNYRYFALSALSLRRYILAPMYMQFRTRSILDANPTVERFLERHREIVSTFDSAVSPQLEPTDI